MSIGKDRGYLLAIAATFLLWAVGPNIAESSSTVTETPETTNGTPNHQSTAFLGVSGSDWDRFLIWSVIGAALAAAAVGVTTIGSISAHKREAEASEHEFAKYKVATDGRIAAANAAGDTAKADAAKANERAAEAHARAAFLEKEAAIARLEQERLKKELGWREITPAMVTQLQQLLRGKQMQVVLHWGAGDAEASNFANQLAQALHSAGIQIMGGNPIGQLGSERHGISIAGYRDNEVTDLARALEKIGFGPIDSQIVTPPAGLNSPGQYTDVFVGYRTPPKL